MILSTRAGSVRQNVHSGVPWTAMLANYQGAHKAARRAFSLTCSITERDAADQRSSTPAVD
jgi:hypothetical protein